MEENVADPFSYIFFVLAAAAAALQVVDDMIIQTDAKATDVDVEQIVSRQVRKHGCCDVLYANVMYTDHWYTNIMYTDV